VAYLKVLHYNRLERRKKTSVTTIRSPRVPARCLSNSILHTLHRLHDKCIKRSVRKLEGTKLFERPA
jgi:hypothetical protein